MSIIELPVPNKGETLEQYINRLIEGKTIQASQIPFAIQKFNSK